MTYVFAGSAAEKAGIVEGCRVLAFNGKPLDSAGLVVASEVLSKHPGDKVLVEWLDKAGNKVRKEVILQPPD